MKATLIRLGIRGFKTKKLMKEVRRPAETP
jgi:hypothetical protein